MSINNLQKQLLPWYVVSKLLGLAGPHLLTTHSSAPPLNDLAPNSYTWWGNSETLWSTCQVRSYRMDVSGAFTPCLYEQMSPNVREQSRYKNFLAMVGCSRRGCSTACCGCRIRDSSSQDVNCWHFCIIEHVGVTAELLSAKIR